MPNNSAPFWIYGSGSFALTIYQKCLENQLNVLGILDNKDSNFFNFVDYEVKKVFLANYEILESAPVYLAICNPYVDLRKTEILIQTTTSLHDVRGPVELCRLFNDQGITLDNYWLTSNFALYEDSGQEIADFYGLLEDVESQVLFDKILHYRKSGRISELPLKKPASEQYLPADLPTPPQELEMLELGSCGGENLALFIQSGRVFNQSFAFEPDALNYGHLKSELVKLDLKRIFPLPLAAWDKTAQLRFSSTGGTSSAISNAGDEVVQAVAIDDLFPTSCNINYIKMDIEGAELRALQGAVDTIRRQTPHLAICVYHTPGHLWELGLWLSANFSGKYKYFLRSYAEQTFETVLYCIPI